MELKIDKCSENPVVQPGGLPWRMVATMNPAVIYENGTFTMFERAAGSLHPFKCSLGMLESKDGIHWSHKFEEPVVTGDLVGFPYGSVQDPRIVKIDDDYLMTFALRPYSYDTNTTGYGVPRSFQHEYPGFSRDTKDNQSRSGVLRSKNMVDWEFVGWVAAGEIDDRNVILFPEKINGKYAVLRRPSPFVDTEVKFTETPGIQLSYSDDLKNWTEPVTVMQPQFEWEDNRIGGSSPPIRTEHGWLILYHGVQHIDKSINRVCYRMGAAMVDINDPTKVIARCPGYLMEPEHYYEKVGAYIPNVVFPTASVAVDDKLHIFYGCCDTAIGLATVSLDSLIDYVMQYKK
ncbi:MAG: glycosidase [Spirochaetales bacterium]|nr:glycosidase [Spirochaetales bacterium]